MSYGYSVITQTRRTMRNYINYSITTSITSVFAIAVGVILIDELWIATLGAITILLLNAFAIVLFGYYELKAEFVTKKSNYFNSRQDELSVSK